MNAGMVKRAMTTKTIRLLRLTSSVFIRNEMRNSPAPTIVPMIGK
jgi:hypothetical protein